MLRVSADVAAVSNRCQFLAPDHSDAEGSLSSLECVLSLKPQRSRSFYKHWAKIKQEGCLRSKFSRSR